MKLNEVILFLNRMLADGIVDTYAIGRAIGAAFYLEPVATLDVDVFINFRQQPGSLLINAQPIFNYVKQQGHTMEGEYAMIAGWPVQFLPPSGSLGEEALAEAREFPFEDTSARVFTAEHLAAIALQTARAKDKLRVLQFVEEDTLDMDRFQAILNRHGLVPLWQRFEQTHLRGEP